MMKSSSSLNKKPVGKVIGDSAAHDETVIKRQKFENEKNAEKPTIPQQRQTLREGPYWSSVDCLGEAANERAISLRELLAHIRPHASIHFNFMVDLGWVFSQYPRQCRQSQCPVTFVVGSDGVRDLRASVVQAPNITVVGAPLPFPYGTHHTKLSLFETKTAVHVVVMTANLIPQDWALKTQALFHCHGKFSPLSPSSNEEDGETTNISAGNSKVENSPCSSTKIMAKEGNKSGDCLGQFANDLVEYLERAYCSKPGDKLATAVGYWVDRLRAGRADFGHVRARLVSSVPGRHLKADMHLFGHMRLRALLAGHFTDEQLKQQMLKLGQFSSIGSLGPQPESWLCNEFLSSLGGTKSLLRPAQLKLVYPCMADVRDSLEGWDAANSLPYQSATHNRQRYLTRFLHKWRSEALLRTHAMPHVKSYAGVAQQQSASSSSSPLPLVHWLLLTSANLSKSAWGALEKGGSQLFIRSYELGVLLLRNFAESEEEEDLLLVLPYDLPLTPYSSSAAGDGGDQPFQVDLHHPALQQKKRAL